MSYFLCLLGLHQFHISQRYWAGDGHYRIHTCNQCGKQVTKGG